MPSFPRKDCNCSPSFAHLKPTTNPELHAPLCEVVRGTGRTADNEREKFLDSAALIALLKTCTKNKDLNAGTSVHSDIVKKGLLGKDPFLARSLFIMYAKCGAPKKAKEVLDGLPARSLVLWNALISGYVHAEQGEEALKCYERMQHEGFTPDTVTFICVLKACGSILALEQGESIHSDIIRRGLFAENAVLTGALVDMYAKCGALARAKEVLEGLSVQNVASWNALITGYAQKKCSKEALECFDQMQCNGLFPDAVTFACILKVCGSIGALDKGEVIHAKIGKQGLDHNAILGGALVDMYAKCGALLKAKELLDGLYVRDVVSWSALIAGHVQQDHGKKALDCFEQMQCEGLFPNAITLISVLKACSSIGALDNGQAIHSKIVRWGLLERNAVLGGALVDMYVKCGALQYAKEVHEELLVRDLVSWSAMITGYVQDEHSKEALDCFELMQCEGIFSDALTFVCILKACGNIKAVEKAESIHIEIVRQGLWGGNAVLGNALVDVYAKCGALFKAKRVLDELPVRDVVSWSALIAGFAQGGHDREALNCFQQMQKEGISPVAPTFSCILKVCSSIGELERGRSVHADIVEQKLLAGNIILGGALVDMYAKCGAHVKAKEVFEGLSVRNVISWNALIVGYVQGGSAKEALNCFEWMQFEGHFPDITTLACVLRACGSVGALDKGEDIHFEILRQGLMGGHGALGNALVDMYARCGAFVQAREVLQKLPTRDVVSWNALITGYVQGEDSKEALNCFEWMQSEGFSPDVVTLICVLKACGSMGALDKGKDIHTEIVQQKLLDNNVELGNALVDMYAKCSALMKAKEVLEGLPVRDVVSWNAVIAGCVHVEQGKEAFSCFEQMQCEGLSPDEITFLCVLTVCSHSGLLEEGDRFFSSMSVHHGILPYLEHHTCMVNLFGRLGFLDKAVGTVENIPFSNDLPVWFSVLTACENWGTLKLAAWAFKQSVELHFDFAASQTFKSNVHVAAVGVIKESGFRSDMEQLRCKECGNSCIGYCRYRKFV